MVHGVAVHELTFQHVVHGVAVHEPVARGVAAEADDNITLCRDHHCVFQRGINQVHVNTCGLLSPPLSTTGFIQAFNISVARSRAELMCRVISRSEALLHNKEGMSVHVDVVVGLIGVGLAEVIYGGVAGECHLYGLVVGQLDCAGASTPDLITLLRAGRQFSMLVVYRGSGRGYEPVVVYASAVTECKVKKNFMNILIKKS